MRAPKLVQLMKANSSNMSAELVKKIRKSNRCSDLLRRVPESEQKQYALEIYRDLTEWLTNETDSILEKPYVALGIHRAGQAVPQFKTFWAVAIARDHFWDYVQQECLHEEPVEFWGGVRLLRLLDSFFDQVFYCVLLGYERAGKNESMALSFLARRRSA
ncbi:MAG: hypothetical protein DMG79_15075 [Acidobacteria bacterium]|nr:MAG: hypothetical protein DMG79_15075 [Acidobacteriota bacterium]